MNFERTKNYTPNNHKTHQIDSTFGDSVELNFRVIYIVDSSLMPFANIIISEKKDSYYINDSLYYTNRTDSSGHLKLTVLKENKDVWITTSYTWSENYSFKINLMKSQDINIYFNLGELGEIHNEVFVYDLKKVTKHKIIIHDKGNDSKTDLILTNKK